MLEDWEAASSATNNDVELCAAKSVALREMLDDYARAVVYGMHAAADIPSKLMGGFNIRHPGVMVAVDKWLARDDLWEKVVAYTEALPNESDTYNKLQKYLETEAEAAVNVWSSVLRTLKEEHDKEKAFKTIQDLASSWFCVQTRHRLAAGGLEACFNCELVARFQKPRYAVSTFIIDQCTHVNSRSPAHTPPLLPLSSLSPPPSPANGFTAELPPRTVQLVPTVVPPSPPPSAAVR